MLEFNTALEKDVLVIELEGSLDSQSASDFRGWFQEKITAGYRAFAIDCLCLEYISSAGISSLIDLQAHLANQSGKMVLFQLSGETRQLLRFLGLEAKMHFANDYDEAIAALTGFKKVEKPEAPAMVEMAELRVLPEAAQETQAAKPEEPQPALAPEGNAQNEMVVEENFSENKKGLHPISESATPTPATMVSGSQEQAAPAAAATVVDSPPAEPPQPAAPPEAREIKVNTGTKRLITCPNCKSVLRVAAGGDYLCPACRFRFTYKGTTA
ncbi:STAS domain-containing protein [Turneriella parva]|uniref:Anti-anti-sigma factor n=1 Tax=Turneriella parva (strain ATCC BAA-1111 / DSM 21527 / NCTC 11395 / H) TaxID=869212 RepID=I4B2D9_TURPD|nr:STAS domain-containing protein [Turneriella parva]AFM11446.1 anti-anti-sigma factor [Turneriella parva DSM 21527]